MGDYYNRGGNYHTNGYYDRHGNYHLDGYYDRDGNYHPNDYYDRDGNYHPGGYYDHAGNYHRDGGGCRGCCGAVLVIIVIILFIGYLISSTILGHKPSPGNGTGLTESCRLGWAIPVPHTGYPYAIFTQDHNKSKAAPNSLTARRAYEMTLVNKSKSKVDVAAVRVVFYDARGAKRGSDQQPIAGDSRSGQVILPGKSFGATIYTGSRAVPTGDIVKISAGATRCSLVTWYSG